MKKTLSLLLAILLIATTLTACGGDGSDPSGSGDNADKIVLRCGFTVSEDSLPAIAVKKLTEDLLAATDGRVVIEPYYNSTLGNERDMVEAISLGTQEMMVVSTPPLINFTDAFAIWDMPYIVENTPEGLEKAFAIMDGEIGREMLDSMQGIGIKGVCFAFNGFRCLVNRQKDITHPDDLLNMNIRTTENDIHMRYYTLLGAKPTPMSAGEAFTALQQGVIDGMDNNVDAIYTQRVYEVSKHMTLTSHIFSAAILIINDDTFNSMRPEDQDAFMTASVDFRDYYRELSLEMTADVLDQLEAEGVSVSTIDISQWKPQVVSIWDQYRDEIDPRYFEAFEN